MPVAVVVHAFEIVVRMARGTLGVFHLEVVHAETGLQFAGVDVESVPVLDGVEETCFRKAFFTSVISRYGKKIGHGGFTEVEKSYR